MNEFDPLPPNYDYLDHDTQIKASEAVYKRQLHMNFQYHLGDPRLISSDKAEKIYGKKED